MSLTQEQESCLIHLAQHGTPAESKDAINQLLAEHQPALYQYAMRALGDHDKAELATQNTLIYAWQELIAGKFAANPKLEQPFRQWLLSCCKNRNYDVRQGRLQDDLFLYTERAEQRGYDKYTWTSTSPVTTLESVENSASAELELEKLRQLNKTVEMLPKHLRRVFKMHMDGLSNKEIAELLEIKRGTVRRHLYQARKLLKQPPEPQSSAEISTKA